LAEQVPRGRGKDLAELSSLPRSASPSKEALRIAREWLKRHLQLVKCAVSKGHRIGALRKKLGNLLARADHDQAVGFRVSDLDRIEQGGDLLVEKVGINDHETWVMLRYLAERCQTITG
jgi:hypothetical protein